LGSFSTFKLGNISFSIGFKTRLSERRAMEVSVLAGPLTSLLRIIREQKILALIAVLIDALQELDPPNCAVKTNLTNL